MSTNPLLFSVVVPTYNRAHLIAQTLETILAQTYPHFEVLIVDDGSKDATEDVVARIADPRVRYFKKANGERGAARNFGAQKAVGHYVNFFDSDDLMYANHLQEAARMVHALESPEFFHLAYDYRLPDGTLMARVNNFSQATRRTVLFDNKLSCNGVFIRRDIALAFPFEENRVMASSEDWELWIRLISRYTLHFSNEITSTVVNHDQRSLRTIAADKIIARDTLFLENLKKDETVIQNYGSDFRRFVAERFTFFMLCLSESGRKSEVFNWAFRAFRVYPYIIFTRRFLASLKNTALR